MLASLSISNFALIDKLGIDFSDGFSIITGETGAGKSILLGALGLVLGKRADLTSLKNKEEKCVIEAHFQIANYNLQAFFDSNDLDYEDETIIRREILPSGKSRAFINDSPVNLQELQDLSVFLIDIHSQHQTQELSEELFQFQIIDSVAENQDNIKIIQRLQSFGVQFEIIEKFNPDATDKLVGKTFVVSGVFELFSRDDLKKSIEDNGGKVGSSISAKTDFVIAGDNMGPAKLEKANQLGIKIISEQDFVEMIKG